MLGSRYADYGKIKSKTALVLDGEDIGEIVNSAAANIVMSISFFGKKAHAGVCPENGIHALKAAAYAAANIPVGHVDDISVQNISNFVSEGPTNIVADKASFDMEFRSYDEDTVQKHIADALAVMKEACEKFGTTFEYDSERHSGAFTVDPESQFIKIFCGIRGGGHPPVSLQDAWRLRRFKHCTARHCRCQHRHGYARRSHDSREHLDKRHGGQHALPLRTAQGINNIHERSF